MTKKIAVFDVLGPAYNYGPWVNSAVEPAEKLLSQWGYDVSTMEKGAKAETEFIRSGKGIPFITRGFVENVLELQDQGIVSVIVSAGDDYTLNYMIAEAVGHYERQTGQRMKVQDVIDKGNIISTIPIGDKKDPKTWQIAVRRYGFTDTRFVYEDSLGNLEAALQGLDGEVGFHVTFTPSGLKKLEHEKEIYRASMVEARDYIAGVRK